MGYQVLDEADQDIGINTNPNYFILNDGTGFSEVIETDFYVLNKVDNTYFDMLVVDLNSKKF